MKKLIFPGLIMLIALLSMCRTPSMETPEAPFVVRGHLYGGDTISDFYIERIGISREFQNEVNVPVENAEIELSVGSEIVVLEANPDKPGYYYNSEHEVIPNSTYNLSAKIDGNVIKANCYVPDTLDIQVTISDVSAEGVTPIGSADASETPIMSFTWAQQEGVEYLLALTPQGDELSELTFSDDLGRFDDKFSQPIKDNAAQLFDVDFTYSGRHSVTIYSISSEYSDYIRYLPTSFDRSLYSAPDNIDGAYGVFAGLTGSTYEIFLEEVQ